MNEDISKSMEALEAARRVSGRTGVEYWKGRDIQSILGYTTWVNFSSVIQRAQAACAGSGEDIKNHFRETTKMVEIGSATQRQVPDWYLTRYACYLIAMNGDPAKTEIAAAQAYFAVQARRQELADDAVLIEKRMEMRERVTMAVKMLNIAAKRAGVQAYGLFHDAGYRSFYGMSLTEIKKKKGIAPNEDLYDHSGRAELAANEFRLTQTEEKLQRENIQGQHEAMVAHQEVSKKVRAAIENIGGTMPENLPAERSLRKIASERKRLAREQKKLAGPKPS